MAYSKIVVSVDINDVLHARAAIDAAAAVCGPETTVHMLYVRYHMPTRYSDLLGRDLDIKEEAEALALMRQWASEGGLPEGQVHFDTRRGRVRDEVISAAERTGATLIVIGSHEPSFSSKLLGSNASAIVHQSPVSVLVVRASAE